MNSSFIGMDLIEKPHRQREPVPEDAEDAMRTSGNQFVIITHRDNGRARTVAIPGCDGAANH